MTIQDIPDSAKNHLRRTREVGRALEMALDAGVESREVILQFVYDTRVYNLYEAFLYLEQYIGAEEAFKIYKSWTAPTRSPNQENPFRIG